MEKALNDCKEIASCHGSTNNIIIIVKWQNHKMIPYLFAMSAPYLDITGTSIGIPNLKHSIFISLPFSLTIDYM